MKKKRESVCVCERERLRESGRERERERERGREGERERGVAKEIQLNGQIHRCREGMWLMEGCGERIT